MFRDESKQLVEELMAHGCEEPSPGRPSIAFQDSLATSVRLHISAYVCITPTDAHDFSQLHRFRSGDTDRVERIGQHLPGRRGEFQPRCTQVRIIGQDAY
jgi:hypothetical protein